MIRRSIVLSVLCVLIIDAKSGGLPVYDAVNHATAVGNEIVNFAKWAETEIHAAATDLNTLNTYEQEILQVERMGDPRTLIANIPGVQNLQTLSEIYYQGEQDVSDWASFVNPQSWKLSAEEILNIYGQPGFNGFTSNGIHLGAARSLVQFQVSNFNTDKSATQTVARLTQQLKTETDQLAAATKAMQSATTESAVQKYQASISALHASIDATNGDLQQAKFSEQLQRQQNMAAEQINHVAQVQQVEAEDLRAIDQGLMGLPVGQMNSQLLWNSQP